MPLIILTGYPTSGKTHRATQLQTYLTTRFSSLPSSHPSSGLRVHLISDHTLSIPRTVYNLDTKTQNERSNNASEKDARAMVFGEVKRVLSANDVVILDHANYIKGWRYQLYCEAKAVRTAHCVVHVGTPVERCREVNESRLAQRDAKAARAEDETAENGTETEEKEVREEDKPYEKDNWENLVFRYEEPNGFTRWDSPLFTVLWDDETPPCEAIWDAVIGSDAEGGKKVVRPNNATVLKAPSSSDYLHELDRTTQGVLNRVLEWVKDHPGEGGGEVTVSDGDEELLVELPARQVGLPALQRLRRQFIGLNRTNPVPVKRIRESFVGYLNDSFEAL